MGKYGVLFIVFILLFSCTHLKQVKDEKSFLKLAVAGGNRDAIIKLKINQTFNVRILRIDPVYISYVDSSQVVKKILTSKVESVRFKNHRNGAIEGLGIGFLFGGLFGAMIGFSSSDDQDRGILSFKRKDKMVMHAVVLGGISGATGLIFGATVGSTEEYLINTETDSLIKRGLR